MHTLRLLWAAQSEEVWLRRQRNIVARSCLEQIAEMPDLLFRERFRLNKSTFHQLCADLRAHTSLRGTREIPLEVKVLCTLSFLATGSYQRIVGVTQHLPQRTTSRCIRQVVGALNTNYILKKWIVFPQTQQERSKIRQEFQRTFRIPGVIGCIDCTHIALVKPDEDEHLYFNRKGYHSLNVQMICDHNLKILNVNSKFGGATHDSFIWSSSQVEQYMRGLHQNGEQTWLLEKVESLESGHGIQVVTPAPEHTFTLDEEALSSLLLREDVRDRAVVVLSVAGAFRKGKSFLLDFFLRYMHHKYNLGESGGEWLGAEDEPLQGFSWRGGSERDTTGLLLWSQPFKATLDNGEKVVIFLMDTQGTFDSESTVRDNATVFALSTMIASVQIYNLSQNIEEDDLQHLQLFTEYGRLAQQSSAGKPFQRLQLLVRDWSFPYEHPYGARGGQQLLAKRLEVHEGQHEELQNLRRHVAACFEELACFLMPHPGLNVATNPNFIGKLSDISPEFKASLKQLVPMLLAPENLVPKLIEGQKIRAKDLLLYFKAYMNIFNGTELPEPKTILEATAEANNLSAVAEAREVYDTLMEEVCGGAKPYLQPRRLEEEHHRARDKALHAFHSKRKMGGDELANTYGAQLLKELEEQFEQLRAHNEGKNIFRIAGTPAVLATLALLGYLLSVLGGALGLQTLVAVGQTAAIAAVVLLAVWAYSRITGNMRDMGVQIDEVADTIRNYIMRQAWDSVSHRAAAAAVGYSGDDKKRS